MTRSAFSASITAPGPTGIPAARSARAKPMTLSAIRPVAGVVVDVVIVTFVIPGRANRTRVYPSSANINVQVGNSRLGWREPGIHTPDRGYGFRVRAEPVIEIGRAHV